jgi:hypothetical protein
MRELVSERDGGTTDEDKEVQQRKMKAESELRLRLLMRRLLLRL